MKLRRKLNSSQCIPQRQKPLALAWEPSERNAGRRETEKVREVDGLRDRRQEGEEGSYLFQLVGEEDPKKNQANPCEELWILKWPRRQAYTWPPSPLKLLSWNCRGFGHPDSINYLKGVVQKSNIECLFLMETKSNVRKMERVCRRLKYPNFFIVEARGTSRGMEIMWKDEVDIECIWHSDIIFEVYY